VADLIGPYTRTWNEGLVRECCLAIDVDAILAIKLPSRNCDDFVSWLPEKSGIFTVRSAYRLGLQPTIEGLSGGQSSAEPEGDRGIWNLVWRAKVPHKLRVFAWRAATTTWALSVGLHHRMSKVNPTCTICAAADEDEHHALITCTLARALRKGMRDFWSLPPEEAFLGNDTEWLLSLLNRSSQNSRAQIIFLLWRVWHHHNNIVHGDGKASIAASISYLKTILIAL
jgi:hypothetical protein